MKIQFVTNSVIPVKGYGGKERLLWSLLRGMHKRGHQIKLLAPIGTTCPFAEVSIIVKEKPIHEQIDKTADIVHFDYPLQEDFSIMPYICRQGGNAKPGEKSAPNTVFVSKNHAQRHGGEFYIYNGHDPADYGDPALNKPRKHVHFLAKAAWKVKNLKGALEISKIAGERLEVIGGNRINLKMGIKLYFDLHARFHGIIGGEKKLNILRQSKGLIFPVKWHEPFGNAMVESMYYGCPVFGTPFGILPEMVNNEVGFLSRSISELADAVKNANSYDRKKIHEYYMENFTADICTENYLRAYEKILNSEPLNNTSLIMEQPQPKEFYNLVE